MYEWSEDKINELLNYCTDRNVRGKSLSSDKRQAQELYDFVSRNVMEQFIMEPTYEKSGNILDLFFCSDPNMILNQENLGNIINSDHTFNLMETNIEAVDKKETDNKNVCSTNIPEYEINGATEEECNNLIQSIGLIDWTSHFNENTDVDDIAKDTIENIELEVNRNMRKKSSFKDKLKSNCDKFKSRNLIPREVRLCLRRKSEGYKKLRKVKTITRCLAIKKKIIDAEVK